MPFALLIEFCAACSELNLSALFGRCRVCDLCEVNRDAYSTIILKITQ